MVALVLGNQTLKVGACFFNAVKELKMAITESAMASTSSPVTKLTTVGLAAGVSWTLQDVAQLVSIAAGLAGFVYSVHLIVDFWLKKIKSWKKQRQEKICG